MRSTMRFISFIGVVTVLASGPAFAASKEQQEMQRDIAQLQDQVRTLQSSFDQKMAAIETLVQQALDAANKANTSVSVLNSGVNQTLDRELRDRLTPVTGLAAKVDGVSNDMADLRNSVAGLTSEVNRLQQQLTDINNAIKVMQAPAAAPPPPGGEAGAPAGTPPAPAAALFNSAMRDYSAGKSDLAVSEFLDFVRFYPDDPNAATAQLYIGQVHLSQGKPDVAVTDFDSVLERFPESKVAPDAYFMKGMALKQNGRRDLAATEWRTLIKKYPNSDQAKQATEQLRAMGMSVGASTAARKKK